MTRSADPVTHTEAFGVDHAASGSGSHGPRDRAAVLREQLVRPMPNDRLWGWIATLFVGGVAALLRMVHLGRPNRLVFDETYYAKDAFSLLEFGYARGFVDGADEMVLEGNLNVFTEDPSFVVHPPAGKWLIAGGIRLFGMESFGWRFAVAMCGVITAMLVVRAGRRLFRSTLLGGLAGLLLAVDGMSIAVSRVAILDGILAMFIVAAFACLLIDRDYARLRYADWSASVPLDLDRVGLRPIVGWRPWRLAAGVLLGLACATKWSGLFALVVLGLLTVIWEIGARKSAGAPYPWLGSFVDGLIAYVTIVGAAVITYTATWWGWIASDNGWSRNWAVDHPPSGITALVPNWIRSLWHYHAEINHFHTGLTTTHDYESPAWGWLLLTRPVSFDYQGVESGEQGCTVERCSQEILALGNPILWWGACAAVLVCLWMWFVRRDWRAGAILAGVVATWVPWLIYLLPWLLPDRTTFAFYAVAIAPFLALAVAYVLGFVIGSSSADPWRRAIGTAIAGAYVLVVVGMAWWFYPIHVDQVIPYDDWLRLMWFRSWI